MKLKTNVLTKKGNEFEVMLPARYEVCCRCEGKGVHDHPAFSNGISSSEMDEDPDFRENYFSGRYDVRCEECNGERVILEVDVDALTEKMRERYYRALDEVAASERERQAERRMGA